MTTIMQTRLKTAREELGVSRERLAKKAENISAGTIRNAEYGARITYRKASDILSAVNLIRIEKGLSQVTMDELGLILY